MYVLMVSQHEGSLHHHMVVSLTSHPAWGDPQLDGDTTHRGEGGGGGGGSGREYVYEPHSL